MTRLNRDGWKLFFSVGALTLLIYMLRPPILWQSILLIGSGVFVVLAMLVGLRRFHPQPRAAWIWIIAGQCLNSTADFFFILQFYFANPSIPVWLYSVLYLLGSTSFLIGLFIFYISFRRLIHRNSVINGLILGTALLCVIWETHIQPNLALMMSPSKWVGVVAYPAFVLVIGVISSVFLMTPIGNTGSYRLIYLTILLHGLGLILFNMFDVFVPLTAGQRDGWLPVFCNASYSMAYFCLGTAFLHPSMQDLNHSLPARDSAITLQDLLILGLAFLAGPLIYWIQRARGMEVGVGFILVSLIVIFTLMEVRMVQLVRTLESKNRQMGRQQMQLKYQASHDALTNLPNRASLDEYLMDMSSRMPSDGSLSALLMIDLDRFKQVNDTFGHNQGDIVLLQVADKLLKAKRKDDMVARWGGDEFVFILENLQGFDDAQAVASRLYRDVRVVAGAGESLVEVTLSIGGCLFRGGVDDIHTALKRADIALYHAKSFRDDEKISFFPADPDSADTEK